MYLSLCCEYMHVNASNQEVQRYCILRTWHYGPLEVGPGKETGILWKSSSL